MSVFLWDCAGLYQHPVLSHEPCGLCLYVVSFSNCVGPHSIASAIKQAHLVNVPRAAEPLLQLVQWREELTSGLSVLEGGTTWKPVAIVPCHFAASAFILLTVKDGDHFSLLLKKKFPFKIIFHEYVSFLQFTVLHETETKTLQDLDNVNAILKLERKKEL